jgi:hypothetical protein
MHIDINRVLSAIGPQDRVLDLGGSDKAFPRANVVVDLCPYESRHIVHPDYPEHFTKDSWIEADFCAPDFWRTVPDKSFDFVIISQTLEDIRDPLYVCSQMIRCAKAGYIEAPSKFRECAKQSAAHTFSGYDHHRWLIEPAPDLSGLIFKAKLSWAHHEDFLGDEHRPLVYSIPHQFHGYFWKGSFSYVEHFPKGTVKETKDLQFFYQNFPYDREFESVYELKENSSSQNDGKCLWVTEYTLASEKNIPFPPNA